MRDRENARDRDRQGVSKRKDGSVPVGTKRYLYNN